ncbi:MAG: hypothetical protein KA151_02255 [Piscinibacter sp.]|nr:hypothetical protein [Piscinibacter sp.]
MNVHPILTHVAVLAVAAGTGWFARDPAPVAPDTRPSSIRPTAAPTASAAPTGQPLIVVSTDGLVTLRVEQQPLDWVLEQIALQAGYGDLRERVRPAGAAASASTGAPLVASTRERLCAESPAVAPAEARRLFTTIERGSEAERFEGLLAAVSSSITVPDALLKSRLETDASDRVRRVALELYLEPRSGEPAALRTALEAAMYVPNAAVQQEARRRLDELMESARPDPSDPQQAPP